jgi:uncharacterized protein (DUF2147 family)
MRHPTLPLLILAAFATGAGPALAQAGASPEGRWRTYDPDTRELRSIVEIAARGDTLEGRVVKRFPPPDDTTNGLCVACEGDRKGKPLVGMTVLWGVRRQGNEWTGGTILQPKTGKEYNVALRMDGGQKLNVRGYLGSPLFGQTQVWTRDN